MEPAALRVTINVRLRQAQAAYERPAEPPVVPAAAPAASATEPS